MSFSGSGLEKEGRKEGRTKGGNEGSRESWKEGRVGKNGAERNDKTNERK